MVTFFFFFGIGSRDDSEPQKGHSYVNMKQLEDEFVLTSSKYLLSSVNIKWPFAGKDMAYSVL